MLKIKMAVVVLEKSSKEKSTATDKKVDEGKGSQQKQTSKNWRTDRDRSKCWVCEDAGLADDHDYRSCSRFLERKKKRDERKKASSSNPHSAGQAAE